MYLLFVLRSSLSILYICFRIFYSKTKRDLKPENFLLKDDSDSRPFIKIVDFGLSRKDDQPTGLMGSKVGTVSKMCSVCARYCFGRMRYLKNNT